MDRSRHSASSLDELRQIQFEARSSNSLSDLRSYFERVQELRRIHSGNFDLQLIVAEAQEEIIQRARDLRSRSGVLADEEDLLNGSGVPEHPAASRISSEPAEGTEAAPDASRIGKKSWRQATFLALFLTAAICIAFFYLIQTARKINLSPPETSAPNKQEPVKATPQSTAAVQPAISTTPTLRLYTDLIPGTVSIDDGEPQDLKDGELVLDHLEAGRHSIKIAGRSGTAAFSFDVSSNSAPQVVGLPATTNAMALLVSAKDGKGHLMTNAQQSEVSIDGKPAGEVGPEGLALQDLGTTDHELLVTQAKDRQRFVMTYTPAPVLTVYVKSDPNAGIVVVKTKQDGVSIFINDKPYRRQTEGGQVRIPLRVGQYVIHVHKDGFTDPPPQSVEVKKAEETEIAFNLAPVPDLAALQIKGAAPGTVVYLDRAPVATVGADGTASLSNVTSGEHAVELRLEGSVPKKFQRKFQSGDVVAIAGPEAVLEKVVTQSEAGPAAPPPPESEKTTPATPVNMPEEQVRRGGGFVPYNTPKTSGHYSFQVHGKIGGFLKHGKLQWYAGYQDSENYILFMLDGKHATIREMRDAKSTEVNRINFDAASDEWVQVDLSVRPGSIGARLKTAGGSWSDMGTVTSPGRDFTQDRVGFYIPGNDEVAISNFRFTTH